MKITEVPSDWRSFNPSGDCLVIRYGAIGDMLQASSVIKALHDSGHSITLNTHANSVRVVKHDPHISAVITQEKDQIPNVELHEYWLHLGRKFSRVVNLSESAERALLAYPGDTAWKWPTAFRDLLFSVDYLEAQHAMAGVDASPNPKFYPTASEKEWAKKRKKKIGRPVVVWALSGSSVHKSYPYTDAVVARLMLETNAAVVFVGDDLCRLLEGGWANEPRVVKKSGQWPIRKALAFTRIADVVVGPETGVLNAVSRETMRKVLFLSHSNPHNFTSWVNTSFLAPQDCPCWPCHKLHQGWATCNKDEETGGAMCTKIDSERVFEAIVEGL